MAMTSSISVLGFLLLLVAVVLGQVSINQSTCVAEAAADLAKGIVTPGWGVTYSTQSICALKGSTVNLSCSYMYPSSHRVTSTFWFTKCNDTHHINLMNDSDYTGRVNYSSNQMNTNTLTITDLRVNDSAIYWFRYITDQPGGRYYGNPGVILSVTGLQVNMSATTVTEGDRVTLNCITTCNLTGSTYIWYKNRQFINNNTSLYLNPVSSIDAGNYSCAVKGFNDQRSPEKMLNVRYGPKNMSVSLSPSGKIEEGSSVTLRCSSDANPPVNNYIWYKKNVASPKASGQSYSITNIRSEDSGEYYCEAENLFGCQNSTFVLINVADTSVCPWVTVVVVGAVLNAAALLFNIYCTLRRRCKGGSGATAETQSDHPDPNNSDRRRALNMKSKSPGKDTLATVHPDSDTYTDLNLKTRSPEYDTLDLGAKQHHLDPGSTYYNIGKRLD
ncbi:hypothetical protein UPYG_G00061470 [Umbra pygmaea]|uniref:Ig-like domain-containing protein n=1 Tax=Umbra pygmaea TaxID=75934 RepID=A0ABD0XYZ2_UMBPY